MPRNWGVWVALAIYGPLAVLLFASAWRSPTTTWIGHGNDPRLFMWYLGWIPLQVVHGHNPLVTDYLVYPAGANLMWNTSVIFPALLLSPVTALLGPVFSYNLLITAGLALSAWFGFLAARIWIAETWLCVLAGLVYGFSPGITAQAAGHPQAVVALFPPIALILGNEILVRQLLHPLLSGGLLGLAAALQLLTGEELLATTVLIGVVGVAILAWLHRHQVSTRLPYLARAFGAGAAAFVLVAAIPLAVQFLGPQRVSGNLQSGDVYVSDLLAFIVPNQMLLQGEFLQGISARFTGNAAEDDAYIGLPMLILFSWAAATGWHRPLIRWCVLTSAAIALLSLGPHVHFGGWVSPIPGPWAALGRLPLLGSALPARLMLTAFLGVGLVVATLWASGQRRGGFSAAVAVTLLAVAAVSFVPALPPPTTSAGVPPFFEPGGGVASIPQGSVVLVTPFSSKRSADAMFWQMRSGYRFRMPEGEVFTPGPYLGPHPSYLQSVLDRLDGGGIVPSTPETRRLVLADLRSLGVNEVVVGPSSGQDAIVQFLAGVIGTPPDEVGGVHVWWRLPSTS